MLCPDYFSGRRHAQIIYIRGWLKTINNVDLADGTRPDLVAFKLNYNTTKDIMGYQSTPLYNGNISETIWNPVPREVVQRHPFARHEQKIQRNNRRRNLDVI